eukprot:1164076-Rhodomonas_salina.1
MSQDPSPQQAVHSDGRLLESRDFRSKSKSTLLSRALRRLSRSSSVDEHLRGATVWENVDATSPTPETQTRCSLGTSCFPYKRKQTSRVPSATESEDINFQLRAETIFDNQ